MRAISRRLTLTVFGALGCAFFGASASAQTATTTTTPTPSTTTAPAPTAAIKTKPSSATPQMIQEAIQRSQARSAKFQATGVPEQWGSEEPFTFNPAAAQ